MTPHRNAFSSRHQNQKKIFLNRKTLPILYFANNIFEEYFRQKKIGPRQPKYLSKIFLVRNGTNKKYLYDFSWTVVGRKIKKRKKSHYENNAILKSNKRKSDSSMWGLIDPWQLQPSAFRVENKLGTGDTQSCLARWCHPPARWALLLLGRSGWSSTDTTISYLGVLAGRLNSNMHNHNIERIW